MGISKFTINAGRTRAARMMVSDIVCKYCRLLSSYWCFLARSVTGFAEPRASECYYFWQPFLSYHVAYSSIAAVWRRLVNPVLKMYPNISNDSWWQVVFVKRTNGFLSQAHQANDSGKSELRCFNSGVPLACHHVSCRPHSAQ